MIALGTAAASNDRHLRYAGPFRYAIGTLTEPHTQSFERTTDVTPVGGKVASSRFAEHGAAGSILCGAGQYRDAGGTQLLRSFCLWCFKRGIKDSLNAP